MELSPTKKLINGLFAKVSSFYSRFSQKWWRYLIYLPLFLVFLYLVYFAFSFSYLPYDDTAAGFRNGGTAIAFYVLFGVFVLAVLAVDIVLALKEKMTAKRFAFSLVLISIAILLLFSNLRFMNSDRWKHDYGLFREGGHWAIIYDIFNTGKWPDVNLSNQYYQPKVFHSLMAITMKVNSFLIPVPDNVFVLPNVLGLGDRFLNYTNYQYALLESTRIVSAFYGSLTIFFLYKIIFSFSLKGRVQAMAATFMAFTPVLWFAPFYGNNDGLSFFFCALALLMALEFRRKNSYWAAGLSAFALGMSMATKLNSAIMAFPIALIFLLELIKALKGGKNAMLRFVAMMAVFAVIVFPIGLAVPLYNYVVYDQPIGYVLDLEWHTGEYRENYMHINQEIYSPFSRVFIFPTPDLFFSIFNLRGRPWDAELGKYVDQFGNQDFSVWTSFFKTTLWGESSFDISNSQLRGLAYLFYGVCLALAFGSFVGLFALFIVTYVIKRERQSMLENAIIYAIFISFAASYAYFACKYPVGCSANARYALPLYIPFHIMSAYAIDLLLGGIGNFFPSHENRARIS